jgi:hypothetical protein
MIGPAHATVNGVRMNLPAKAPQVICYQLIAIRREQRAGVASGKFPPSNRSRDCES